jgi:XTP/dITP diphosphohydrolase
MASLILATRNLHKVQEIRNILGDRFCYLTLMDIPEAPAVIEDAGTFAGNATKKALELAKWISQCDEKQPATKKKPQVWVLADDSGLEVDVLDGAPGVHSARFAASDPGNAANAADEANRTKLLRLMQSVPIQKRTARFRCVIALTPLIGPENENASPVCYSNEAEIQTELFDGACEGRLGFEARGQGGFGYDSLFIPAGYEQTFAELTEEVKNRLSHRGKALEKLKRQFFRHA